ncbi:hypothetical protein [Streptomyces sp. NRRL B-3648]|uniref:hypothetical protein n=1 Tax=Streptomyces sp. NRRL B-3648 TaxID=1519493 RepID=UPI000A647A9D|nr:hypothetical protein [Streptomyces sp. NRRL B-3648]
MLRKVKQALNCTALLLACMGVAIIGIAFSLAPEEHTPAAPARPSFAIKPSPEAKLLTQPISVLIAVGRGGSSGECAKFTAYGPGLQDAPGWHVVIKADDRATLVPGSMKILSRQSVGGITTYELASTDVVQAVAAANVCWRDLPNMVVARRGSSSIIAMPNFYVDENFPAFSQKPNPEIAVDAYLDTEEPDWAVDAGLAPDSQQSSSNEWVWYRSMEAGYTHQAGSTATLVVHSISDAASDHQREFMSGILFGVGAAALVASIQELLNQQQKEKGLYSSGRS